MPAKPFIFGTFGNAPAGPTLVDSYSETNQGSFRQLDSQDQFATGQTFVGDGAVLDSAKFYLLKTGAPSGNATARLYALTGTPGTDATPTGAALATSDNFDVTTLTGSYALITFSFSGANRVTLTNGTNYCIACYFTGGNASNYVRIGIDLSSPTHAGNEFYTSDGTNWTADSTIDAVFYLYSASS
jgi:hypothetical protein